MAAPTYARQKYPAGELRIVGPFHARHGYGRAVRGQLAAAVSGGFRVEAVESDVREIRKADGSLVIEPLETRPLVLPKAPAAELRQALQTRVCQDAPTILHLLPDRMHQFEQYQGPRIGFTMTECDGVRPELAHRMRQVDLLVAPSRYVSRVFAEALYPVRVFEEEFLESVVPVLPNCIDPRVYPDPSAEPGLIPLALRKRPPFLFMAVATTHPRKRLLELMHCFAEEFAREPVGLVLKVGEDNPQVRTLALHCREYGAWVRVENGHWSDAELASLYGMCSEGRGCFCLPSHEGFGLPFAEAAHYGVASIALDAGGQTDVVTDETGYLAPAVMRPCVGQHPRFFSTEFRWAVPDLVGLKRTMRRAYQDRPRGRGGFYPTYDGGLKLRALAAQEQVEQFYPEAVGTRLREIVQAAGGARSKR